MIKISKDQILRRISLENPWWGGSGKKPAVCDRFTPRPYLKLFFPLLKQTEKVRRAVVLLGPRRVGKTVLIHHTIGNLIDEGFPPNQISYCSVDHPLYNGLSLEELVDCCSEASGVDYRTRDTFLFFDEIQYHPKWEAHLKSLVDSFPTMRIVVSGSAAAALRLKSLESGAGRFTDFLLPPLTFYEYLSLLEADGRPVPAFDPRDPEEGGFYHSKDIAVLNDAFLNYLNYGGYPEVVLSEEIQRDPVRFVKADIIDKVLLRDLPSLYGIKDIQELNSLFTTLAYNSAKEVTLDQLSQGSGVAKNTIKRYIEYLEAAFLIRTVQRVDMSAKRFRRANFFKVYLTNPSIRSALFSPVSADDQAIGQLVETAVYSQWFHSENTQLHYARWSGGEIDLVSLAGDQSVHWAVEAKWSDRFIDRPDEMKNLVHFCEKNSLTEMTVTTRSERETIRHKGIVFELIPSSEYCYTVGRNIIDSKDKMGRLLPE